MRGGVITAILGAAAVLAACGDIYEANKVAFEGHYFSARLSRDKDNHRAFAVQVSPVSLSLSGAREAGRYEATKYCIENYGSSAVAWTVGPDSPDASIPVQDDSASFSGACRDE
jgi:hypothetical protein